jgi:hypothetical protein
MSLKWIGANLRRTGALGTPPFALTCNPTLIGWVATGDPDLQNYITNVPLKAGTWHWEVDASSVVPEEDLEGNHPCDENEEFPDIFKIGLRLLLYPLLSGPTSAGHHGDITTLYSDWICPSLAAEGDFPIGECGTTQYCNWHLSIMISSPWFGLTAPDWNAITLTYEAPP